MNYRIKRHMSDFFLFFQLNLRLLIWFLFVGTSWCKKKEAAFAAAVVVQLCPCSNIVSVNKWLCTARNIWTMRFILCSPNIQKNPLTIQWCRILNIFALSHFTDMNLIHQHVFLQLCCSCLSLLQFPLTEALRRFKYFSAVVHHHLNFPLLRASFSQLLWTHYTVGATSSLIPTQYFHVISCCVLRVLNLDLIVQNSCGKTVYETGSRLLLQVCL